LPTGSNGNYAIGSCHATTSSTVMSAAIGQSGSFSVVANNATFGDPCTTIGKTLAVKLGFGISVNGPSQDFTITVNPTPSITTAQTATICSGGNFSVTPTNGGGNIVPTGTTYTWTVAANANVTGETAQTTAQTAISQTLTNTTNVVQTVVYTVTPVSPTGPCTGSTFTVTVTVNPTPVVPTQTTAACSGSTFTVSPTNNPTATIIPSGTTYSWSAPTVTGITGTASGSNASSISGTLTNTTNLPIIVNYTVTPSITTGGATALPNGTQYLPGGAQLGTIYSVTLTGSTSGTIWGSGTYTDDSDIAAAAVHSGVLANGATNTVYVQTSAVHKLY